jgi:hypothetical protein
MTAAERIMTKRDRHFVASFGIIIAVVIVLASFAAMFGP